MTYRTTALLVASLLSILPGAAAPAAEPTPERFSVTTGKPLAEGEKPPGEAVMTVYHPAKPNGTAVMIYPGGGYTMLVVEPEGQRIAKWFGEHGVTGIVVEYRLPNGDSSLPLADAERATRIVRSHATDWKLKHVGNIGFSAGGHLAATAATHFDRGDPKANNPIDKQSCRPDFSILVYPVITMGELTHGGSKAALLGPSPDAKAIDLFSNEKQVTRDTPPTFIAHAENDTLVVPANSQMYYDALEKNKVPAEYLKLPTGGHGLNGYQGPMWEQWKTASLKWLAKQKLIPAADAN
ncbi:MAG: alpha/beta hydrolase [Luteolibacter sp.]|uniref:alpha/beta hydrolase n=1 Tax=Luteolibacter sp. TaxID=1962973 RepID=UPI003264B7BE